MSTASPYPRRVAAPPRRQRDSQRSAVYEAEDRWSRLLDSGGLLDFFGSRITLPVQRRFGTVDAMQVYSDWVLAQSDVIAAYGSLPTVTVRLRAGQTKAHYEPGAAVIAIPMEHTWAARESVLLHELAHHVVRHDTAAWHGPTHAAAMVVLAHAALGPEAALVLRAGYEDAGLAVMS